jgi:hypothetical protein
VVGWRWVGLVALVSACGRSPLLVAAADDEGPAPQDFPPTSCEEVDILFVIDDSPSMGDNQRKLVENYDVFVEGVTSIAESRARVHLGVVTTDKYAYNVTGCQELGDLVVQTGGHGSSDAMCGPYADGGNYMTDADDIDTAFRCAAKVGTTGATHERPMEAAINAIGGGIEGTSACNQGFVRDGAMLVVVFVTDEDGELDPNIAYEAMMEARGWNEGGIVVATLANLPEGECSLSNHAEVAADLVALTELFPFGFLGSVCADDYREVFAQAVSVVADACAD